MVRYNDASLYQGSFPFFYYSGVKEIVRYTEEFVILRLMRFHYTYMA